MNARRVVALSALGVFLGLGSAHAQPTVYDLTAGPGEITPLIPNSNPTLDIYIDSGATPTSAGVACENGNGDELCAIDVELSLTGPGVIDGFMAPATGPTVVYEPFELVDFPTSKVRLNVLQSISPPTPPTPQNLGALSVTILPSASEANPVKVVATGQAVDAAGALVGIPVLEIAKTVPEPSGIVLLLSGALGLAALHWLRTRGSSVAASGGPRNSL
jgi:hypothetical protein